MKKLFVILGLLTCINTTADARTLIHNNMYHLGYQNGYNSGHHQGKNDAYRNVGKTVFFVGTAIIVGAIIYEFGKESNWTSHDGQVGYRF